MVRRVVTDDLDTVSRAETVETESPASIVANVITVLYAAIVSLIGLDALLELMDARESNGFVNAIDTVSAPFLAPFQGMFDDQNHLATSLIAAVVYTIVYLLVMAAMRRGRTRVY